MFHPAITIFQLSNGTSRYHLECQNVSCSVSSSKRLLQLNDLVEDLLILTIGLGEFVAGLLVFRFRRDEFVFIRIRSRVGKRCFQRDFCLVRAAISGFQLLEKTLLALQFLLCFFIDRALRVLGAPASERPGLGWGAAVWRLGSGVGLCGEVSFLPTPPILHSCL